MSEYALPRFHVAQGLTVKADYQDPILIDYRGNPLLEALPPIWDEAEVSRSLASKPHFELSERDLPSHLRLHCVQRISRDYFQPLSLHLDLEQRMSRLIRDGYVGRNPIIPNYAFRVRKDAQELIITGKTEGYPVNSPTSSGFAMVGISGIGKSTAILKILSMYPQVIIHNKYKERAVDLFQIVWLKMDCPHDGSIKGLCLNFFFAVDSLVGSTYYNKYAKGRKTVDELLPIMAQVAALHCIGVLVIDEIQNLREAKEGLATKMLSFFVQLVNTIGMPVVVVGTFKATPVLNGEFRNARRSAGQGDLVLDRLPYDEQWEFFLRGLWKYQWTKEKTALTEKLIKIMYEESQGITDIAVKLFMLVQWRTIDQGFECIYSDLLVSVAREHLKLLHPALKALKSGNQKRIAEFGDIYSSVNTDDFLDELTEKRKKQERINLIRSELEYEEIIETKTQTLNWLINVGINEKDAKIAVELAFDEYGSKLDQIDIRQVAVKNAMAMMNNERLPKTNTTKRTKKSEPFEADDLRIILKQAMDKKITPYDAFKKVEYIKDPREMIV